MFAVSGRHLFAYRGLRIDLEYFLQRIVFGGDVVTVAWMRAAVLLRCMGPPAILTDTWQQSGRTWQVPLLVCHFKTVVQRR